MFFFVIYYFILRYNNDYYYLVIHNNIKIRSKIIFMTIFVGNLNCQKNLISYNALLLMCIYFG